MKKAYFQLHLAVFLAGFTGILGRLIELNEGMLVWYRLLISSITMWILFTIWKKVQRVSIRDLLGLAGTGFIIALHWVSFYGSIKYANVSVALVCFSSVGFFTALLEPLVLRIRIKWIEVILGIMVLGGIAIIFHFDPRFKTGIILGVISAILLAFTMIVSRQYVQRINPESLLTYQLTGGFIGLSLLMPAYTNYFPSTHVLPQENDWLWLFILSWICTVLAFVLNANALKRLTAFTVNLNYNLEPVYGILLAFVLLRENEFLGKWFWVGAVLIGFSLVIHAFLVLRKRWQIGGDV